VAFLGKPFDPDALLAKIRALLDDVPSEKQA
jgi:DNA-binding response OmpR family regulator